MKFEDDIQKVSDIIATVFGIGYTAYAPGTIGSLFGILIYMFLKEASLSIYLLTVSCLFVVGTIASEIVESAYNIKDPSFVIIDEVVGMLVTLAFVSYSFWAVWVGFLFFRIIDISKIPPLNFLERIGGGLGIMLDDLAGGLMAGILLYIIFK
ncbi:Phosphatidylglycerophosphatase A [Desulfurella amilsii]|uniref:Phosphatidylglycerophosphatase A n=1 Tax=Desulfurella amilsii TaxID=1562698 RepID=A0A1X4XWJ8_9BACT|nr:phosphatidylglycerophosphatase A [Desulfurella amilsii]OSS41907.1 Phosphatidylglycerophosphatase A [Desulfurella amilsii]